MPIDHRDEHTGGVCGDEVVRSDLNVLAPATMFLGFLFGCFFAKQIWSWLRRSAHVFGPGAAALVPEDVTGAELSKPKAHTRSCCCALWNIYMLFNILSIGLTTAVCRGDWGLGVNIVACLWTAYLIGFTAAAAARLGWAWLVARGPIWAWALTYFIIATVPCAVAAGHGLAPDAAWIGYAVMGAIPWVCVWAVCRRQGAAPPPEESGADGAEGDLEQVRQHSVCTILDPRLSPNPNPNPTR
mmetsp:Transcript_16699/g.51311  ORF Transcript_16699/g.51311 Transcript_16699/m.51311 type:complete len:242 (-) Transcript_16699:3666-4391(-)